MGKLLGIFAHPDDESVSPGGTIAKYAKAGWQVDLVCATRGEAGGWGEVAAQSDTLLADVREKELKESGRHLGVRSVTFLDYMDGTLSMKRPRDIEDAIVRVVKEIQPDVILTHEPAGITNHPDHIKISFAATFAFQTYAKARVEKNPNDSNPPKLYYACFPETLISYVIKHHNFPSELFDAPVQGVEDKRVTTVIDIKRTAAAKRKAMQSHVTQRPILLKYMDIPNNPFFLKEYFILRLVGEKEMYMGKNDRISDRL